MRFTRISGNATNSTMSEAQSPLAMLLGCHARIRHFMQLSRSLAEAQDVPHLEIADAASAIFRYFSHALPLHEADENETLFPRLCAALPHGLVREAAETMVEQHKAIDELTEELLSLCASLKRDPERLPLVARRLEHVTFALDKIFAAHLRLEETVVFPFLDELLSSAQMEEMLFEMNQRRRTPSGAIHLVQ
jgi:hemerythrin-like domain-containing protein